MPPDAQKRPTVPPMDAGFSIRDVHLRSRVIPAPMCEITDRPFRSLLRAYGADLVVTQMLSVEGLVRGHQKTLHMLDIEGEPPPVCVQLVGYNPESFARAAQIVEERGAVMVDINMGCPSYKVTGNACGSALMKDPDLAERIVRTVSAAIRVPLTVKMRAGWDARDTSGIELARRCEAAGACAVALHARTREQAYKGKADWTFIARMKDALSVPVIGNGDVTSPAEAVRMMRETNCDAVMIGRGVIGNPWLLGACDEAVRAWCEGRIRDESEVPGDEIVVLEDSTTSVPIRVPYYMNRVTVDERLDLVLMHTRLMVEAKGERRGVLEMRKHSQQYIKGIRGCKVLRERLMKIEDLPGVEALMESYRESLKSGKPTM
jgi:tRNA-dihydrouridine synthase B